MDTPIKSQVQIHESLDGRLLYRHVLYREKEDHHKSRWWIRRMCTWPPSDVKSRPVRCDWTRTTESQRPLSGASLEDRVKILLDRVNAMELFRYDAMRTARARQMAVAERTLQRQASTRVCALCSARRRRSMRSERRQSGGTGGTSTTSTTGRPSNRCRLAIDRAHGPHRDLSTGGRTESLMPRRRHERVDRIGPDAD